MEGNQYKKGLWTVEEDKILMDYISIHGEGHWSRVATKTGLKRCGKSCRLRWMNYLCPKVKRGNFSEEEEDLIIRLHNLLGNRWSLIAGRVPGRTDNQVKNYWNTHLSKKLGIRKTKRSSAMKYCNLGASPPEPAQEGGEEGKETEKPGVSVPGQPTTRGDGESIGAQVKESSIKASDPQQLLQNESISWFSSENLRLSSPCFMEFQDASLLGNLDEVWCDSIYWL